MEISPIESGKHPDEILIIDCAKHNFETKKESERMTSCSLCSGGQMEFEVRFPDIKAYLLTTVHSGVPVEDRQKKLKETFEFWSDEYAKEPVP